ncbi:hypothetical protein J6590_097148 [Homalodisca vitripennis]|nr:hypothetical protein J6590_097148 [Homalodisca vitripennis]
MAIYVLSQCDGVCPLMLNRLSNFRPFFQMLHVRGRETGAKFNINVGETVVKSDGGNNGNLDKLTSVDFGIRMP